MGNVFKISIFLLALAATALVVTNIIAPDQVNGITDYAISIITALGATALTLLYAGFFILGGGYVYFLPSLRARNRKLKNTESIFFVNLFFGWTLLGWVVCLAWASAGTAESKI